MDKIDRIYEDELEICGYTCEWYIVAKDGGYIAHMFLAKDKTIDGKAICYRYYVSFDLGDSISPTQVGSLMAARLINLLKDAQDHEFRSQFEKPDNSRIH